MARFHIVFYQNQSNELLKYGQKYLNEHPDVNKNIYFRDVYEEIVADLFYKDLESFQRAGLKQNEAKEYLEKYFNINLDV